MKSNKNITYLLMGLALLVLPLFLQLGGNAWVRIVDMALLYVLLALGLNIVVVASELWGSNSIWNAIFPTSRFSLVSD